MDFPELMDPDTLAAPLKTNEVASEVVDRAEIRDGKPLVAYSMTEAGLATLRTDLAGKTYDLTTVKGNDAARGDRLRCVTLRTSLEKRRKELKAPVLAYGKLIDTEAARITAEIEALEAPIDAQILADEARREAEKAERERIEREKAEAHAARLATVNGYADRCRAPDMTADRISAGMARLEAADLSDPDNARAVELADARCRTLETMRLLHAQAQSREAEAARQEAIRLENERQAAALAEERKRIEAEAAEIRRQAAELAAQRAESERLERLAEERRAWLAAKSAEPVVLTYGPEVQQFAADLVKTIAVMDTEGQDLQQVLKAEPETADATDRETPADASPRVGAMGAGQAADAAPEVATIKLGTLCDELGFKITEAFIRDTLKIERSGTDKQAILYTPTKRLQILRGLVARLQGLVGAGEQCDAALA